MQDRFRSLDGWRAVSILFVLAGHLLPLGPKSWHLNGAFAGSGMALFFILSGFLITTLLLQDSNVKHFLIRRFMRIVPLAWLVLIVTLVLANAPLALYPSHLLFYGNLWDVSLVKPASHFWSLCVEMQFYVGIALMVALFGTRRFGRCCSFVCCNRLSSRTAEMGLQLSSASMIRRRIWRLPIACAQRRNQFFLTLNSIPAPVLLLSAHEESASPCGLTSRCAIEATLFKTDTW
jgi:peptidoglycan/LPS O-acetylase OafA/YrhL